MSDNRTFDVVKDFVMANRERFVLATDIYDSYPRFLESLLNRIYKQFEEAIIPNYQPRKFAYSIATNNHYFEAHLSERLKIQIAFLNYFRGPYFVAFGVNSQEAEAIQKKFESYQPWGENTLRINLPKFMFDRAITPIDVFDLCHTEAFNCQLMSEFKMSILPTITETFRILTEMNLSTK